MIRFFLILTLGFLGFSFGQEIKGIVTDNKGLPLPNVNIISSGKKYAITDFDGNFTIICKKDETLTFSFIGFQTLVIKPKESNLSIVLEDDTQMLSDIVVVGYGTKKSGSITGSVTQLKSEEILKTPGQNAIQSIQGKAAGVNIVTNDEPGANPSIQIRGLGTLLSNRNPLYVIDGVEATGLNGLSSNDILTIDILKDASSLAIYGQKGSSGVILITTKKGKKGNIKVSFDSNFGIKDILKKVKMANSSQFAYFNNYASGSSSLYNNNQPYNTNWLEEITNIGTFSNNSISISGAGENNNFLLSASNFKENGILRGTEFERNNITSKNEFKLFDSKLKITQFLNFSNIRNTPKPNSAFTNAYKQSPIMPVYYPNGQFAWPFRNENGINDVLGIKYNDIGNPVAQLEYTNNAIKSFVLLGSIKADLFLTDNFTFTSNFGGTSDWSKGYSFVPNRSLWLLANPTLTENDYLQQGNEINNSLTKRNSNSFVWNWDNYLTYKKSWKNHTITAVGGISKSVANNFEELGGIRNNVPENSNYWTLNLSSYNDQISPISTVFNFHSTPVNSIAYFTRFEYEYDEKYLITASIRREGISSFQKNKRWGNFPSISAGWILTKENFLSHVKYLNYLKMRAGYGEVGNANGPANRLVFSNTSNYTFGANEIINPGAYITNAIDPNLTWETMKEINIGFDAKMFDNKLTATFDIYNRNNSNLILPVRLPNSISEGDVFLNTGSVTNKGIELALRWDSSINENIKYWIGGNISFNQNKLNKVNNQYFKNLTGSGGLPNGEWTKKVVEGDPLGSFYVFETIGFNSFGEFILNDMVDGVPGLTDNDRVNAGSYIPKYTYGVNLGVSYKRIELSVDLYGVGGNKVFNGKRAVRFQDINIEESQLSNFYTPSNPNAVNPSPSNITVRPSTHFIEDGSFLRVNNITLGYTLPTITKHIEKIRIFANAINPFIFTKFSGFSPELVGNEGANPLRLAGIELDSYPTNKTFSIGLNVTF